MKKANDISHQHNQKEYLATGLFSGWVSLLITNFFGFSVVITQLFLFLFPAIIIVFLQKDSRRIHFVVSKVPKQAAAGIAFTGFLVAALCLSYIGIYWIADTFYAKGYRQSRQGLLTESYKNLTQAVLLRPTEPNYYDELGVVLSGLAVASMESGNATNAAALAEQGLAASDRALSISPNNVNFWKSRTKIYFGFSGVDSKFTEAAIEALQKAYLLSPNDPKIAYNLAVLYGRLGENEKAIEYMKETITLKPNYRDAYYALYVFYSEVNQPNLANSILEEYLQKVDPNDQDFQSRLSQP